MTSRKYISSIIRNPYHLGFFAVLLVFVMLHIPVLRQLPYDSHSWRQTDTAAVARNYQEETRNFFLPRIDMRGDKSGVTGMELPVYNYSIYMTNQLVGFHHWTGRVISLFFACLCLIFFYCLLAIRYNKRLAILTSVVLAATPVFMIFSKNIQPDIFMLACSIGSLLFAQVFVKYKKPAYLYLSIGLLVLACLIKIPAIFITPALLIILPVKQLMKKVDYKLLVVILAGVLLVGGWYKYSGYLSSHFGLGEYFYGNYSLGLSKSLVITRVFWTTLASYIADVRLWLMVLPVSFYGAWLFVRKKDYFAIVWFASVLIFLCMFASKSFFHNYYILPLIPPLAILLMKPVDNFLNVLDAKHQKLANILLICGLCGFGLIICTYTALKLNRKPTQYQQELTTLESSIDQHTARNSLFIVNGNGDPTLLYFAHRKGWSFSDAQVALGTTNTLTQTKAQYLLLSDPSDAMTQNLQVLGYQGVQLSPHFVLYKLR